MGCIASGRTRACDALRQKPHQEAGSSPAVFTSGLCGPMTGAPLSLCTAPSLNLPVSPFLLPQEWSHKVTWLGQITLESIVLVAPGGCFQGNLTFSCSLKATCGCGYTCDLTLRVGRFLGRKTVMMKRTEVMTAQTQILQTRFRHGRQKGGPITPTPSGCTAGSERGGACADAQESYVAGGAKSAAVLVATDLALASPLVLAPWCPSPVSPPSTWAATSRVIPCLSRSNTMFREEERVADVNCLKEDALQPEIQK